MFCSDRRCGFFLSFVVNYLFNMTLVWHGGHCNIHLRSALGRLRFAAVRALFYRDGAGEFARRDSPSNTYCHGLRRKLGGESGHHCRILRFRRRSCDAVVVMPDAQPSHQHYCVRDICVGRSVSTSSHHALLLLHSIGWRGTVGKLSFRFSAERTKRKTHPQEAGPNPNQHGTLCSQQ